MLHAEIIRKMYVSGCFVLLSNELRLGNNTVGLPKLDYINACQVANILHLFVALQKMFHSTSRSIALTSRDL